MAVTLAGPRCSYRLKPFCWRPVINSIGSRPLVTYQVAFGSAVGSLISMRLLSKYCTVRLPSTPSANCSRSTSLIGSGPHVHERPVRCRAIGRSCRFQTRWKAGLPINGAAKVVCAASTSVAVSVAIVPKMRFIVVLLYFIATVAATDGSSVAAEPFRHHNRRIRAISGYADIGENWLMLVTGTRVSYNDRVNTTDRHTSSAVQIS